MTKSGSTPLTVSIHGQSASPISHLEVLSQMRPIILGAEAPTLLLVLLMDFLNWAEPAGATESQQPDCSATLLVTHPHGEVCQLLATSGPRTAPHDSLVWAGRQDRAWEVGPNRQNMFGWYMHRWSTWRVPATLKKQHPRGWEKHWIIHHAPNYCSSLFHCAWMSVCFSWDAVMSWNGAPVCKWKRCSSWKPWGWQEFAQFNPAHLGFMFCNAGRESIPPRFLWRAYLCKYRANYDDDADVRSEF